MGDSPEQQQNCGGGEQPRHGIDHQGSFGIVAECEVYEETGREHEYRVARRVANLKFGALGDEFRAVPETGCGLYRHAIDGCGDQESDPTHEVVYGFVLFHSDYS